jgi:L-malate glycosyltransferase
MIVMCICHFDETNSSGGLDKQARLLSKALAESGEEIVVISSTRKLENAKWSIMDGGARCRLFWTYASPQLAGRHLPAAIIWAAQILLWIVINRKRISVVHGHQIRVHAFVMAVANLMFGIPTVLKSATGGAGADIRAISSRKYLGRRGLRFIVRHTSSFVAISNSVRQDLESFGVPSDKVIDIPNGALMPIAASAGRAEARWRRCAYLGRVAADKNVIALARASTKVIPGLGLTLDIYGGGKDVALLTKVLSGEQGRNVTYRGHVSDVPSVLNNYGWLLLPSNAEGLSNAMIEAMIAGVVPVTTRVSGCIDHIDPGITGYFLDGVDEPSIEKGLQLISQTTMSDWRRMSHAVEEYARRHFDITGVALAYQRLYRSLETTRTGKRR